MLKLVVLSPGMTGRTQELNADKTTIGRAEDNTFQIAEASVSSHHCEVLLRESEVIVRDLNSTNGTYINGQQVTESGIKPGQMLRLGEIQMRLETDAPAAPAKRQFDRTTVIPGGVNRSEFDHGPGSSAFDTKGSGFSRKDNKVNEIFIIIGVVLGLVILALLIYIASTIKK
jgi:hypothetical protein